MSLDHGKAVRFSANGPTSRRFVARSWATALAVGLALAACAALAPARLQDPAPAGEDPPAAKPAAAAPADVAPGEKKALPAPSGFAKPPETPKEIWEVVDFLIRSGQGAAAVPYIRGFLDLQPSDDDYLTLRDEFGVGAFSRLGDTDATRPYLKPVTDRLHAAIRNRATNPDRIQAHVDALTRSEDERKLALAELASAGSHAIAPILAALGSADEAAKAKLVEAMGRLDASAVPGLSAALESKDDKTVAAVAAALGSIGDRSALADLAHAAARVEGPLRDAVRKAFAEIHAKETGSPSKVLADEARKLLDARPVAGTTTRWVWDEATSQPKAVSTEIDAHRSWLASRFARAALLFDPTNASAQKSLVALSLQQADAGSAPPEALAAGADILGAVAREAAGSRRHDLAVKAITALAKVSDRNVLGTSSQPHALLQSLQAPDRRVQIAAAEAVVGLDPKAPFPGSSLVVPILARFAANPRRQGAVVIDGNNPRGTQITSLLNSIGYDARLAQRGEDGFRLAAGTANIELVVIDPTYLAGAWDWRDTLSNLRADARTSGLPVFLVGPLSLGDRYASKVAGFSDVHFLVAPTDRDAFKGQVDRALGRQGVVPLSEEERAEFALRASQLLTKIAETKGSAFAADLAAVEPDLILALNHRATTEAAAAVLASIPGHEAQRSLALTVLESTRDKKARLEAAEALASSLRRFGPLLKAEQEVQLVESLARETDAELRTAIATVVGALKPKPATVGRLLSGEGSMIRTK